MKTRNILVYFIGVLGLAIITLVQCSSNNNPTGVSYPDGSALANHTIVDDFDLVPESVIEQIKSSINIYYGHTSHGSQISTGMAMIRTEDDLYEFNNGLTSLSLTEYGDDLGHNGDTSWVPITRNHLSSHSETNMVVWSWCGGCSDNTVDGINTYLNAMAGLETDYPNVTFIYMTGHLDGTGVDGNLYARNNQIRSYCSANDKYLFDFADIESYDPSGTYYPDESDGCSWCTDWCAQNTCPDCGSCAHSHCYNCYLKGKAFWWLMARVTGWNGTN